MRSLYRRDWIAAGQTLIFTRGSTHCIDKCDISPSSVQKWEAWDPRINFVKFGDIKRSLGSSVLRQDVDASVFIRYSTDNGNFDAQCGITEYHNAHSSKVLYWNYHSQATVRNATFVLVGNQPRSGCADEVINVAVV